MTRARPEPLELLATELECSYCEAEPGEWCYTRSGVLANYLHSDREWVVRQAWGLGYEYGWTQGYNTARGPQ